MSERKNTLITTGLVLSISLIAIIFAVVLTLHSCNQQQFNRLNAILSRLLAQEPAVKDSVSDVMKEYTSGLAFEAEGDVLTALGYHASDFSARLSAPETSSIIVAFLLGVILLSITFLYRNRAEAKRILALTNYLAQVNLGKAVILSTGKDDEFSKLEDEIYKTVTFLYQTKDMAIQAKNHFADNLSNIAHQIKTPITAISLITQVMAENSDEKHLVQIRRQLERLTHLEEALLVLSRLDAGTLLLEKKETDVYTILMLAADNLQELSADAKTTISIPELGEMAVSVDPEWTIEAIMNLMKNCIEHNKGGRVYCAYAQNPLYTEILIWDEGDGFSKEDIPHLFERFYRGQKASEGGIGIGLSLSKEIVERQNGTIRARNLLDGGACFEIRFYRH